MATKKKTAKSKSKGVIASGRKFSFSPIQKLALVIVAVLGVTSLGYLGYTGYRNYAATATVFEYVGTHPQASTETTDKAKMIQSLEGWNGKMYIGYGDWDANTGPVAMTPFDPSTGSFASTSEYIAPTEAIETFRVVDGKLYAVHVDPRGGISSAYSVATKSSSGASWSLGSGVKVTHAYGFSEGLSSSEMFLAGQVDEGSGSNEVAKIFRSTDGGATWSESLSVPSRGGYNRMTFVAKFGGKIYAQRMSMTDFQGSNPEMEAWAFNGSRWSKANPIAAYQPTDGTEFAGKLIMKSSTSGGNLLAYDGRKTTRLRSSIRDYVIGGDGYLYVLGYVYDSGSYTQVVTRTKDLSTWENVTYAPKNSSALGYLDGTLYIGTFDSELYRAEINPNAVDSTAPTVALVLPSDSSVMNGTKNEFAARASDESGIRNVEFYVDDYLIGSSSSLPAHSGISTYMDAYTAYWDGAGVGAGTHEVKAIAYDIFGNAKASATKTISVPASIVELDKTAPSVTISYPSDRTKNIRKSVNIRATAQDDKRIASIEVYVDGKLVGSEVTSSAYATSLTASVSSGTLERGNHTINVVARDATGNVGETSYDFRSK